MGKPPVAGSSLSPSTPTGPPPPSTSASIKEERASLKPNDVQAGPEHEEKPLRHDLDAAALVAELPDIHHELIPLGFIVHRVVGQVYAQLEGLTDILPSKNDTERRQLLVDFVKSARKHLVRLLVLAQWSAVAYDYKRAQDIVGFLQAQNTQVDGASAELQELRDNLNAARVRNYDISTALDVLTTGTYDRPPAAIKSAYATPARLPDEVVRATLQRLDEVIQLRLAVHDELPPPMGAYRIADGRAYFSVDDLFEASLTVGGEANEDRWYLLHADFSPGSNVSFSEPMRQRVIELANTELEPRESPDPAQPDRPLHRLYVFLRDLALDFRIERLHSEALKLAGTTWKGNVEVKLLRDQRTLSISYWTNAIPTPATQSHPANVQRPAPSPPPRLYISVAPRRRTAASLIAERLDDPVLEDFCLVSTWEPEGVPDSGIAAEPLDGSTTIETLLDSTVRRHLDSLARQLYLRVREEAASQLPAISLSPLSDDDVVHGFRVSLRPSLDVEVVVDRHTGRLSLRPTVEIGSAMAKRIRILEKSANAYRHSLFSSLGQIRALAFVDELEAHCAFAGLRVFRPPSLRSEDRRRLKTLPEFAVMLPLIQLAGYYVLALAGHDGVRFALASTRPPNEEEPTWSILEMAWVKPAPTDAEPDIKPERVLDVARYCALRVTYLGLEQQLALRLIAYQRIAPTSSSSTASSLDQHPLLAFRISDVLAGATFAHSLVIVRAVYRSHAKPCQIVFRLRLTTVPPDLPSELPIGCELDPTTRLLTATYEDAPHASDKSAGTPLARFFELVGLVYRMSTSPSTSLPVPAPTASSSTTKTA